MTADKSSQKSASARCELLTGSWRLVRTISDGSTAVGTAQLKRINDSIYSLREDAETTLANGERLTGSRDYALEGDGDNLILRFADGLDPGGLFQTFSVVGPSADSTHRCGDDTYLSTLNWLSDNHFEIVHRVSGPKKNYVMKTSYLRAAV